jgi:predicted ATPase
VGGYAVGMPPRVPYLVGVRVIPERLPEERPFPFNLPILPTLDLRFDSPVTFFVGENGTGKSTLLEAIAALCRLPVSGGSRSELADTHGPEKESSLSRVIRPAFQQQPRDGFFLRAEFAAYFASLLEDREKDPDFAGNPYVSYGGRSLHKRSHGEAFLAILQNRFRKGLFLLDEPESALSPQRQLALLTLIYDLVGTGESQFIIASHSPILMTYPHAQIISFDDENLHEIAIEDTSHYQVTRGILENPEGYWKYLSESDETKR